MLADINQRIKGTGAYQRYKHSLIYVRLREWDKALQRRFHLRKYRGTDYCCPVCGVELSGFVGAGSYVRMVQAHGYIYPLDAIETFNVAAYSCPSCDASDRERLYALYLDRVFAAREPVQRCRLLEFAPSFGLSRKLKRMPFVDYRSAGVSIAGSSLLSSTPCTSGTMTIAKPSGRRMRCSSRMARRSSGTCSSTCEHRTTSNEPSA